MTTRLPATSIIAVIVSRRSSAFSAAAPDSCEDFLSSSRYKEVVRPKRSACTLICFAEHKLVSKINARGTHSKLPPKRMAKDILPRARERFEDYSKRSLRAHIMRRRRGTTYSKPLHREKSRARFHFGCRAPTSSRFHPRARPSAGATAIT